MSRDHRKLRAFELTDSLVISVYEHTRQFPREEQFGLTSQLRRAAVSSAANIVEGCARETTADYLHFLTMSLGSLRGSGYLIDLSSRLGYINGEAPAKLAGIYEEAARVLSGLISSLR